MSSNRSTIIDDFPKDDRYWRVDWFGGIERNVNITDEPLIQLIISPIESLKLVKSAKASKEGQITIRIGVGQIPTVTIGSIWKNGRKLSERAGSLLTASFNFDDTNIQHIKPYHKKNDSPIINWKYYRYGSDGAKSNLLLIDSPNINTPLLIPEMELIRFYFCTSSLLSKTVFNGDIRHHIDSLVNIEKCRVDEEQQAFHIHLRPHVLNADAWVLARILQSTEAYNAATKVHDSIIFDHANDVAQPKTFFPFTDETKLKLRGKKIKHSYQVDGEWSDDESWYFLVFEIINCAAPFPFSSLSCERDNDNRKANPETDKPDDEKKPLSYVKKRNNESNNQHVQNQQEPNKDNAWLVSEDFQNRFEAVANKELQKPDKDQCNYKSKPANVDHGLIQDYSTADGGYAESDTGHLELQTQRDRIRGEASFQHFAEIAEALNECDGVVASMRPLTSMPLTHLKKSSRPWCYVDSSKKLLRSVGIIDINFDGKKYYLIEIKPRTRANGTKESLTMALLKHPSNIDLSPMILSPILTAAVHKKGVWKNIPVGALHGFQLKAIKHTRPSAELYAERVFGEILKIKI